MAADRSTAVFASHSATDLAAPEKRTNPMFTAVFDYAGERTRTSKAVRPPAPKGHSRRATTATPGRLAQPARIRAAAARPLLPHLPPSQETASSPHPSRTPFKLWTPRLVKAYPDPATRSLTVREASSSPEPASAATRAAI